MGTGPADQRGYVVHRVDVLRGGEKSIREPRGPASPRDFGENRPCPPIHSPEQRWSTGRKRDQVEPSVVAGAEYGSRAGSKFPKGRTYQRCGQSRAVPADENGSGGAPGERRIEGRRHPFAEVSPGLREMLEARIWRAAEDPCASGWCVEQVAVNARDAGHFLRGVFEEARIERRCASFREGGAKPGLDLPRDGGFRQ
jgi:hypothetical protein